MPPKVTGSRVLSGEKGSPYGMGRPGPQVIGGGMKMGKGGKPAPAPRPVPRDDKGNQVYPGRRGGAGVDADGNEVPVGRPQEPRKTGKRPG